MLVVTHSMATSDFDWRKYALNLQTFPKGESETLVRVIADPVKTTIMLKSLNSLRILSLLDFHARCHEPRARLLSPQPCGYDPRAWTRIRELVRAIPQVAGVVLPSAFPCATCRVRAPEHLDFRVRVLIPS